MKLLPRIIMQALKLCFAEILTSLALYYPLITFAGLEVVGRPMSNPRWL